MMVQRWINIASKGGEFTDDVLREIASTATAVEVISVPHGCAVIGAVVRCELRGEDLFAECLVDEWQWRALRELSPVHAESVIGKFAEAPRYRLVKVVMTRMQRGMVGAAIVGMSYEQAKQALNAKAKA